VQMTVSQPETEAFMPEMAWRSSRYDGENSHVLQYCEATMEFDRSDMLSARQSMECVAA
jgi:hypothetical protein